jgi:hypothetical protein
MNSKLGTLPIEILERVVAGLEEEEVKSQCNNKHNG